MKIDQESIPQHVAFIMDGNRRHAKKHRLNPLYGHTAGADQIEPLIDKAIELKIPYLTFWAFSTENWNRNKHEVAFLLKLFKKQLESHIGNFHKKNVKLNIIGNLNKFPQDIQDKTKEWMETTKNNKTITVNVALSYGGRDEIIRAFNRWHSSSKLNTKILEKYLDTAGQPDPDLLIRTGGEKRLSGFMLWQIQYTELYFSDLLWPEFMPEDFVEAIVEYQMRQRRFGK